MNLRFDTRQQTLLNIIQNRVVLNNVQVLSLGHELLVGILAGTSHHGVGHLLRLHLLGNLASSYVVLVIEDDDTGLGTYHYHYREGRHKRTGDQRCRGSTS